MWFSVASLVDLMEYALLKKLLTDKHLMVLVSKAGRSQGEFRYRQHHRARALWQ
jgi:hypothetical protein